MAGEGTSVISVWKGAAVCYLYNSLSAISSPHPSLPPWAKRAEGGGDEMAVIVRAKAGNGKVSVRDTAATAT